MTTWNEFTDGDRATPAEFVAAASGLLGAAVAHAGGGAATRRVMIDGLGAILTTDRPTSTMRLDVGRTADLARSEFQLQAKRVADLVIELVERAPLPDDGPSDLRSHCVGYQWTDELVSILIAPGRQAARNLYNEWQWQLVLLRDLLLPFTSPAEVRLAVGPQGLHGAADGRDQFIAQLMTRRISHEQVISHAALATGAPQVAGAYGFTFEGAAVLPAVLSADTLDDAPAYLLTADRTHPELPDGVSFVPAEADQLAVDRVAIAGAPRRADEVDVVDVASHVACGPVVDGQASIELVVGFDGHAWRVDLGQCLRGHRYALRPPSDLPGGSVAGIAAHSGCAVLREQDALVRPDGLHLVPTGGQQNLGLALLGRSTPGDVVLYRGQDPGALTQAYGPDLVLLDLRA